MLEKQAATCKSFKKRVYLTKEVLQNPTIERLFARYFTALTAKNITTPHLVPQFPPRIHVETSPIPATAALVAPLLSPRSTDHTARNRSGETTATIP